MKHFGSLLVFLAAILTVQAKTLGQLLGKKSEQSFSVNRNRVIDNLARQFIDFFDIEQKLSYFGGVDDQKKVALNKSSSHHDAIRCNTLDEINDYFFQVYSSDNNGTMLNRVGLEDMIEYQIQNNAKNKELSARREQYKCDRTKCFQSLEILDMVDLDTLDRETFSTICPIILYNFELRHCEFEDDKEGLNRLQTWLIGLVLTAVVTIWSWNGALVLPFIKTKIYKRALTMMISLAFGVMSANSILKYLPLADGFENINLEESQYTYFYKHLIILGGLFFFFNFERSMKLFAIYKTAKRKEKERLQREAGESIKVANASRLPSIISNHIDVKGPAIPNDDFSEDAEDSIAVPKRSSLPPRKRPQFLRRESIDLSEINILGVQHLSEITDKLQSINEDSESLDQNGDSGQELPFDYELPSSQATQENKANQPENGDSLQKVIDLGKRKRSSVIQKPTRICCTSLTAGISKVRPIGWMAIFGDGLGNFIDGLSIGASINQSLVVGVTTAIATWFGNIPQELGDFALLVRAGMTPFQALFYNFMSAQSCYLGFIIGVVLGQNLLAARWIFSISSATGMYLSLAVLLPEMNEEFNDENETFKEKLKITGFQNLGILIGYSIMIVLNVFEEDLEF